MSYKILPEGRHPFIRICDENGPRIELKANLSEDQLPTQTGQILVRTWNKE